MAYGESLHAWLEAVQAEPETPMSEELGLLTRVADRARGVSTTSVGARAGSRNRSCGGSSVDREAAQCVCSAVGHAPAVAPVRYPQYPSGVVSASTEGYATAPRAVPRKPAPTIVSICLQKRWALLCKSVVMSDNNETFSKAFGFRD